jgi:hypothetical protein
MTVQTYNDFLRVAKETAWNSGSAAVNEVELLTPSAGITSGTFTLTYGAQTTTDIPWNATNDQIRNALWKLSTIGYGNVRVTGPSGGPWSVAFINNLGGIDITPITADVTNLVGGTPAIVITTTTAGVAGKPYLGLRAREWSLINAPSRVFPDGEKVGQRDLDTMKSVKGRRFGSGSIPTWFRPDTGGLMVLAALGSEVVTASPSAALYRKKHQIRCADMSPSLVVDNFRGAVVSSADKAYEHKGMSIDTLDITWDATNDTGSLDFTYGMIGRYGSRIDKPPKQFSDWVHQAAWNAVVYRNGTQSAVVQSMRGQFANNVARIKAGVGSQDDQDRQFGGRTFRGTMTLIYTDETEYDLFEASGEESIRIVWTDENLIETVSAVDYYGGLELVIPRFEYSTFQRQMVDGYYAQEIGFRAVHDDTIGGPLEIDVYNAMAAY